MGRTGLNVKMVDEFSHDLNLDDPIVNTTITLSLTIIMIR